MNRIIAINHTTMQVTVQAGIRLKDLGPMLWELGYSMRVLGTVSEQSIAGAISTGTHGSGKSFRNIPSDVVQFRLVTGEGQVLTVSETENPDIYRAVRVSMGTLGIITEVTLQCVRRFNIKRSYGPLSFDEAVDSIELTASENTYYKIWWLPHTERTRIIRLNPTDEPESPHLHIALAVDRITNRIACGLFYLASWNYWLTRAVSNFISMAANMRAEIVGPSYMMFQWPMPYHYMEAEWFFPADKAREVLIRYKKLMEDHHCPITYVSELRFVAADDALISPAYGRDSATLNMLRTGIDDAEFYRCSALFEKMMEEYNSRPHWGKWHTRTADQLRRLYGSTWDQFLAIRSKLDPADVFLNDYMRNLFYGDTK